MQKISKISAGVLTGILFIATPLAAGAVTIDELQNQVNSLLRQIAQAQGQTQISTSVSTGTGTASSGTATATSAHYRVCEIMSRNLSIGSRGNDVSSLQEFLNGQGFLSVQATGYFGAMTAKAVAKWQASQGLSAVGAFGPLSRGRLSNWCNGNIGNTTNNGNGVLQADPMSGDSPLTVTFTTSIGINDSIPSVDFGDGQIGAMSKGSCVGITAIYGGEGGIKCSATVVHTYSSNGSFTATLVNGTKKGDVGISVGSSQGSLQADPQSGTAPLPVSFTYAPKSENGAYYIEYGDGAGEKMDIQQIYCIKAPCISPAVAKHTYTSPGTYQVSVSPYIACLYTNPRCMIAQPAPLAKTTVTVFGTGEQTFSATPQSGSAPLMVKFKTWISGFHVSTVAYKIDYGDGYVEDAASCNAPADACITPGINSHTYAANGTYTATLTKISNICPPYAQCFAAATTEVLGKLEIKVGSSSGNKPPVISGFSGPTTLSVGATGTWSIQASDPENQSLSYHVIWGDESAAPMATNGAALSDSFVQTTTFTHSYSSAGTYTVKIVAKDAVGNAAQTTATVKVGSDTVMCTMEYAPVCGQPAMPVCPTGSMCPMYYPAPKTYGNRCSMNAAGATFLYSGECSSTQSTNLQVSGSGRTVTIGGPDTLMQKINACVYSVGWYGAGGNGTTIEWGDGTYSPTWSEGSQGQSCSYAQKTHTYSAAGTYTIKATIWHPGPTDAPETDWTGTAYFVAQ